MLDSEPVFKERMTGIGISDAFQLALIAAGITTLARLAFSSASMPGSGDDSAFIGFLVSVFALTTPADIPAGQLLACKGFGTKLTRSQCPTSGHGPKLRKILLQEDFQSRKELPDLLHNKFDLLEYSLRGRWSRVTASLIMCLVSKKLRRSVT